MHRTSSLSATNLAVHHHLNCDLYIHNVYHQAEQPARPTSGTGPVLSEAQFKRGLEWESTLFSWLDESHLLLAVPSIPLDSTSLLESILVDERDHFFIAGLTFWPPLEALKERFIAVGSQPLNFGLAKPDLLEITRRENGVIQWRVIEAKASKAMKTSHQVQIYFYTLCLSYLLSGSFFRPSEDAGVWLPPKEGFRSVIPSENDIKTISISLLSSSLDHFLFRRLPRVLALPREEVDWHFNPLCCGCQYEQGCKSRAVKDKELGSAPNITIDEARTLKNLLRISHSLDPGFTEGEHKLSDIEDLHLLLAMPAKFNAVQQSSPSIVNKSQKILALPRMSRSKGLATSSPVIEAVRRQTVQVIKRRNFTFPSSEDVAIVISIVLDPSSPGPGIEFFSITSYSSSLLQIPNIIQSPGSELVPALASIIRTMLSSHPDLRTQFYVWSVAEQTSLQTEIINAALTSTTDDTDIRLCIGALAQGASLLQTTFQPMLLSGALLSFLAKGKRNKAEYQACLQRMGLSTVGTVEQLKKRLNEEIRRIRDEYENQMQGTNSERQKEFGHLPRVVVVKKEVERQLALPIPGYWELPECMATLLPESAAFSAPSDEGIFKALKHEGSLDLLEDALEKRNNCIYAILQNLRSRINSNGLKLLVNGARLISTSFMDICREENLRKLFFMQQFEVLTKLTELWQSRLEGCPDAPVLQYQMPIQGSKVDHKFRLVSGTIDVPTERDHPFYEKLLALDSNPDNSRSADIPVEALFDDLTVSGLIFPLNRYTMDSWRAQHETVQKELAVADVRNVAVEGYETIVTLRVWGTWGVKFEPGAQYRLSPRLIDFNTSKVLSALLEIDLQYTSVRDDEGISSAMQHVPFLQLIVSPRSLGGFERSRDYLNCENGIQRLFRNLRDLGDESATSLLLKPSQHKAVHRILSNRLSVVWGPPGTGKTYTICLSLLRLFEVEHRLRIRQTSLVFITAFTHVAIEACRSKLVKLMNYYRKIDALPTDWLDGVKIEHVVNGNTHNSPSKSNSGVHIYTGTLYQLYNFSKRHSVDVDCVVVDEAGQIALASLSLVLRSLAPEGRVIIAGDSEQLAPILSGQYPRLNIRLLFGSVLDCLIPKQNTVQKSSSPPPSAGEELDSSQSTVIQLTENFRLNPDLGEFISIIYAKRFNPQKVQARQLSAALKRVEEDRGIDLGVPSKILDDVQNFFISLSRVMLRKPQDILLPPTINLSPYTTNSVSSSDPGFAHHPVSLALIRLQTSTALSEQVGYEMHVRGEASVAASLVISLMRSCPGEDIFVATPYRVQREAVRSALSHAMLKSDFSTLEDAFERSVRIDESQSTIEGKVTIDTIERLQGSEAAFVICLFSIPPSFSSDLGFILERRRLNVAISRAKSLCILVASPDILNPSVKNLSNEVTAKGFAFLKAYEERAWSYELNVGVDYL